MKPILRSLFAGLLLLWILSGQENKPVRWAYDGQNGPVTIPTTAANVCTYRQGDSCSSTQTVYLTSMTLYSPTATPDTCYVLDRQSSPQPLFGTVANPETVSGLYVVVLPDRKMANGIRWACTNGTTTATLSYHIPQ